MRGGTTGVENSRRGSNNQDGGLSSDSGEGYIKDGKTAHIWTFELSVFFENINTPLITFPLVPPPTLVIYLHCFINRKIS